MTPLRLLRWFFPASDVRIETRAIWTADDAWRVRERYEFSAAPPLEREMVCRLLTPDRIHVTADDLPRGAEIALDERGFRWLPYRIRVRVRGIPFTLRCVDENLVDADGAIHDTIRMRFLGVPVATMRLSVVPDRDAG